MGKRPRHFLRRQRRLWHNGRSLWVREPVQPGLRRKHSGAQHGSVQQRAELRRLLRDQMCQRPPLVPLRKPFDLHYRNQLLPAELRPPQRQWRLVQPSPPSFRPRHAHVPQNRRVPCRNRPRRFPPSAMPEARRDKVHDQRVPLLQPGADHQRRRSRRRREGEREGFGNRVDQHEPQLGAKLAIQRRPGRPVALLPGLGQRPPDLYLLEHRAGELAIRPNLRWQELQGLILLSTQKREKKKRERERN